MNIPSGAGQNTKDKSMSIVHATDDPALAALLDLVALQGGGDTTVLLTAIKNAVDGLESLIAATNGYVDGLEGSTDGLETLLSTVNATAQKLTPLGPGEPTATPSTSLLFNVAFTANTAQQIDLSGANYVGLKAALDAGKVILCSCTGDLWINWAASNVTIAAAATAAATPATQGFYKAAGAEWVERGRASITRLNILGGGVAGVLCLAVAE